MVYPRSYATFAAVCAVSLCLLQGGDAGKALKHGASAPKHVAHAPKHVAHAPKHVAHAPKHVAHAHKHAASAVCAETVSSGDAAVGINIVTDTSCVSGGVGCIDDVCRFCKVEDTIQSSHLVDCGLIGSTPVPTTAAPGTADPATTVPVGDPSDAQCATSSGDYAVGIQGIYDASCAEGGLGCASDVCRHCKWKSTAQSSHLLDCSTFAQPTTAPATTAPATTAPATDAPATDAPATDVPTTDATATTSPPVVETEPPMTFAPSDVIDTECPWAVSEGDAAVGIQLVGDATCVSGGLGCYEDICRYCKYKETPASKHLNSCLDLGFDFSGVPYDPTGDEEVDTTPTPSAPVVTAVPGVTGCGFSVSPGDFAVGIQLVGDASCAKGGVGCYEDVCRYCKYKETAQSSHLIACGDLGYDLDASPAPSTESPMTITPPGTGVEGTGCPFPVTDVDHAVGIQLVGDASCISGGHGCYEDICRYCKYVETPESSHLFSCANLGYTFDVTFQPSGDGVDDSTETPTTEAPVPGTDCPFPITEGDYAIGIQLVGDPTCANGGVGCYENVCRYCKYKESTQSSHLVACKDLGFLFGGDDTNDDDGPTTPPTTPPTAIEETRCPYPVSEGDFAVGIQLVGDETCANGGVGCYEGICRYCKYEETPQSSHLVACVNIGYGFSSEPIFAPAEDDTPAPTPEPSVIPGTGCPFPVTEGDYSVGIHLVGDDSCAWGGIGCHQDVCRYCRYKTTPQSSHLLKCKDLGYDFGGPDDDLTPEPTTVAPPTAPPTPIPETDCIYPATEGDITVGIQLVGDATCAAGGVGCYEGVCRYCKFAESPQSMHLLACVDLGYSFAPEPTFQPADDSSAGETDAPTPAPSVIPDTMCPFPVSTGDYAVGIHLVGDETCASGGIGCFESVCRFCMFRTTPASSHLIPCKDLGFDFGDDVVEPTSAPTNEPTPEPTPIPEPIDGTGCPYPVSAGDEAVGIQLVGDATCANGGVGCYEGICRYCKFVESAEASHLLSCSDLGYAFTDEPIIFTPAEDSQEGSNDGDVPYFTEAPEPTTEAPAPTSEAPAPTTEAPTTEAPTPVPTPVDTKCAFQVSDSDKTVGIQLVGDATCASGGLGCFADVCRFCKVHTTAQSAHLLSCKDLGYTFDGADSGPAPTTAPTPISEPIAETGCPFPVSEGDFSIGIQLVGDATCANGGLGCYEGVCRYCKHSETAQSSHLLPCVDFGYPKDEPTFMPTDDETDAPEPSPATPIPGTGCAYPITEGDYAVGIQLVGDATCTNGGAECYEGVCRYCQFKPTDQSSHLVPCSDLGYIFGGGSTPAPEPSTEDPVVDPNPTTCPLSVSEGDFAVGIQLITDASCVNGGLGCLAEVCRFCKFRDTPSSTHLLDCANFGVEPSEPPHTTSPTATPPAPASCEFSASEGDLAVGIQVVPDDSCVDGGLGCFADVCRYCKVFNTNASSHLDDCSKFVSIDVSDTTDEPEPTPSTPSCGSSASDAERKVGIEMVTDLSCAGEAPVIGCVDNSICRFCKSYETSASIHLNWCAGFDTPAPGPDAIDPDYTDGSGPDATPAPVVTTAPVPGSGPDTTPAPVVTTAPVPGSGPDATPAPVVTTAPVPGSGPDTTPAPVVTTAPVPGSGPDTTPAPVVTTAPVPGSGPDTTPAPVVTTAPVPGSGPDTTPAPVVTTAPVPGSGPDATPAPVVTAAPVSGTCTETVSPGDAAAGIGSFVDASCLSIAPGVGCIEKTECRLCKNWDSVASMHLVACPSSGATLDPVATNTPASDVTSTPSTTAAPSAGAVCSETVSTGDAAVGIDIVDDASCPSGVGCIDKTQCRFCKRWESAASSHLSWCPTTDAPPVDTGAPSPATTSSPSTTDAPPADTGAPSPATTSSPSTTTAPSGDAHCGETVSEGDASVGIAIIADASCPSGVGCIDNTQCRFCKKWNSPASTHLEWCPTSAGEPAPTEAPTEAPGTTEDPGTVTPPLSGDCDQVVSEGDAAVGIGMSTDPSCFSDADGIGCIEKTACRLCKRWATPASGHLNWCVGDGEVPDATIEAPPSDATPVPTLEPEQCSLEVSQGDSEGGVAAVFDPSCLSTDEDNTGCFGGVCRFCKYFDSEISSHFFECDSYDATITPLRLAAKSHKSVKTAKAAKSVKKASKKATKKAAKKVTKEAKKAHKVAHKAVKDVKAIKSVKAVKATTSASEFDELLKDKTFKWAMAGAACIGVAAVLALFALGAKRVVARRSTVVKETAAEPETAEVAETAAVVESEEAAVVAQV